MSQHHQASWTDVIAKHAIDWEDGPDGGAVLLVPRFRKGPLARWLQPKLRRPHIRVRLDEFGSFVWRTLDGGTPFQQVVEAMRTHFGEKIEPADERLQKFLTILVKDKFVELFKPAGE